MDVGIVGYGFHLPYYRMKRETIGTAWERRGLKGERCVANTDEDSVTLAVEAARNSIRMARRDGIEALYFASVTAPYAEKSHSTLIATACDLRSDILTADFGSTPKAGTSALSASLDAVLSGYRKKVCVTAADCPIGYPKSDHEQFYGDAGASVVVGSGKIIARLLERTSISAEIIDVWRNYGERSTHYGEARFIADEGYKRVMTAIVKQILKKSGLLPGDFSKIILSTSNYKDGSSVARKCGFEEAQVQESYMDRIGNCVCAQPLLLISAALESANPGDKILLANYGNGADAFVFEVTDEILNIERGAFQTQLNHKKYLESYVRYLSFRGILEAQPGEPFRTFPSNSATWREQKSLIRMHGAKCKDCGTTVFPFNRVCPHCLARDHMEEVSLSDRTAKLFTFSVDNLAGRSDDPMIVQSVLEDPEGTRYYLLMTDFEKKQIKIGIEVEFVFRMIYEGGNFRNYYWKCRPLVKKVMKNEY